MSARGEYICISCWTAFESVPDASGMVSCPHCEFTQPATDDGDNTIQTAAPRPSAPRSGATSAPPPRIPSAARSLGSSGASAMTLPTNDMDSLEAMVAQPSGVRSVPAPEEEPPPPARSVSVPMTEPPAAASEAAAPTGPRIWRVKSDAGLTYCFFEPDKLIRWVDGLGPQKNALVSLDGINWKTYGDFKGKYVSDGEALSALESASEHKPVAAPAAPAGAAVPAAGPAGTKAGQRGPASPPVRPSQSPTRQGVRPKPNATAERRSITITGERPSDLGLGDASPTRRPQPAASGAQALPAAGGKSAGWGARMGFMAAGMILGGAGVYFGLYLMGYYDLAMPF